jgi:hypothetical protein
MSKAKGVDVDLGQAQAFLTHHLDTGPSEIALIGEGAWSRCFGFRRGDEELVVRFGNYVDDFRISGLPSMDITPSPHEHTESTLRVLTQPNGVPLSLR